MNRRTRKLVTYGKRYKAKLFDYEFEKLPLPQIGFLYVMYNSDEDVVMNIEEHDTSIPAAMKHLDRSYDLFLKLEG